MEVIIPGKLEPFEFEIKELWDTETDENIEYVNPGNLRLTVKIYESATPGAAEVDFDETMRHL